MKKIIIGSLCFFLLFISACKKTPTVKKDELRFVLKSENGGYSVYKDGVMISPDNIDREVKGVKEFKAPLLSGVYRASLTSQPPGFCYIYIFVNDKKVAWVERSNKSRVDIEVSYTHP
jgi:hypothetical protein